MQPYFCRGGGGGGGGGRAIQYKALDAAFFFSGAALYKALDAALFF